MTIEQFPIQPKVERVPNQFESFSHSEHESLGQALAESEHSSEAEAMAEVLELLTQKAQSVIDQDSLSPEQLTRLRQSI